MEIIPTVSSYTTVSNYIGINDHYEVNDYSFSSRITSNHSTYRVTSPQGMTIPSYLELYWIEINYLLISIDLNQIISSNDPIITRDGYSFSMSYTLAQIITKFERILFHLPRRVIATRVTKRSNDVSVEPDEDPNYPGATIIRRHGGHGAVFIETAGVSGVAHRSRVHYTFRMFPWIPASE